MVRRRLIGGTVAVALLSGVSVNGFIPYTTGPLLGLSKSRECVASRGEAAFTPVLGVRLFAGKGFGSSKRNGTEDDPQLLFYHQQKESAAVTTDFLRFAPPRKAPAASGPPPGMRVFDRVVDFPCIFTVKVIGQPDESFDSDMVKMVGEITGRPWQEIKYTSRDTDSKKYRSLTIQAPVANADQLYQIYEAVGADPRVRFKF